MSATTEAAFYDEAMASEGAPALLPLEESPWRHLYAEAARWIPSNHNVTDLGCGTGTFLQHLAKTTHNGEMVGIDFSARALAFARSVKPCRANFVEADLRDWQPDPRRAGATTYTCLEVLEHLKDDRELVSRIPPGHQFIGSVPNYESEAHLRVFRNASEVFNRYQRWLTFRRWSLIELGDGRAIHAFDTVRRSDSW